MIGGWVDFSPAIRYNANSKKGVSMYIDPNTGGILFQALAGLFVVFSSILFFFSRNIREYFARLRRRARKDEDKNQK